MIEIKWVNLMPGYTYKQIEEKMICPAIYKNPEMQQAFAKLSRKEKNEMLPPCQRSGNSEPARMYKNNNRSWAKRMLKLLLSPVQSMVGCYEYGSYPVWTGFRNCWKKLLEDSDDALQLGGMNYKDYIRRFYEVGSKEKGSCVFPVQVAVKGRSYFLGELLKNMAGDSAEDENERICDLLATLSVIACVWYIVSYPEECGDAATTKLDALLRLIFPQWIFQEERGEEEEQLEILPRDRRERRTLGDQTRPSTSAVRGTAIFNACNAVSCQIEKTAPRNWACVYPGDVALQIKPGVHQRILLIDDELGRNITDALAVLTCLLKGIDVPPDSWKDTEIYIRCPSEDVVGQLLDTAMNCFPDDFFEKYGAFRLYLIDEARRTAQNLYACHPSFYPLTQRKIADEGGYTAQSSEQSIHLVILSDNDDQRYAQALIREAFWTLPRQGKKVQTKMTVFSPYAEEISDAVCQACPELSRFSSVQSLSREDEMQYQSQKGTLEMNLPPISYWQMPLNSKWLHEKIRDISATHDHLYFVVDSHSDLASLTLGIRLREEMIRYSVHHGKPNARQNSAIVAVHCQNSDIADFSRDLVVPGVKGELSWYNSYRLLPFGSLTSIYGWDKLSGGLIEERAQCMHLEYSGKSVEDPTGCAAELQSYFANAYNRDSSFAAACSLPYRLYEAGLYPEDWDITDPDGWWNEKNLEQLARRFVTGEKDDVLAEYEHMRWAAYQMARGWCGMTARESSKCIWAGVPKHMLQVARLHPCLCSWDEVKKLQEEFESELSTESAPNTLNEEAEEIVEKLRRKDFARLDISNIRATPAILQKEWLIKLERIQEKTMKR